MFYSTRTVKAPKVTLRRVIAFRLQTIREWFTVYRVNGMKLVPAYIRACKHSDRLFDIY